MTPGSPAPKKSLGQHFLINDSVCKRIVKLLQPAEEDQILEIGPGPGALTRHLLTAPHKKLLLIEKDSWWAKERAQEAEVCEMDAMQFKWHDLCEKGHWKLVGNLPYNIASPLIWNILSQCRCWRRAVFMVQKEVAQRICAQPGSRQYGALSVWIQSHAQAKLHFGVSPGSFRPPPKVDSAVVTFVPLPAQPRHPEALKNLLDLCFQQRRKQLSTIFRQNAPLQQSLKELDIKPELRPEALTPEQFQTLAGIYWHKIQAQI